MRALAIQHNLSPSTSTRANRLRGRAEAVRSASSRVGGAPGLLAGAPMPSHSRPRDSPRPSVRCQATRGPWSAARRDRGEGQVPGELDEIPKPVIGAPLTASRARHGDDDRPFAPAAQALDTAGRPAAWDDPLRDENSLAKAQNVRGHSSAILQTRPFRRSTRDPRSRSRNQASSTGRTDGTLSDSTRRYRLPFACSTRQIRPPASSVI